jgi:micrococcal nuclease
MEAAPGGACRINRVVDGDTVGIVCPPSGPERGRLMGFDTPELFSPRCVSELVAAERAKWVLRSKLWSAKTVRIETHGHDRYDRRLIRVYLDGRDVSGAMISGGYARPYDGGPRGGWC